MGNVTMRDQLIAAYNLHDSPTVRAPRRLNEGHLHSNLLNEGALHSKPRPPPPQPVIMNVIMKPDRSYSPGLAS
ncbi:hypothetical protein [Tenggerimyces flavus]|uniref:Uncharacterized protein n=1 Tax=Tenggerimyces flavus TaxID=1708749 RepID=A0ABV7YEI3_9ACTN